ncbi:MAG: hypothetical protein MPJ24_09860, partial [Pirellulaceae bacterium]|nr:hypothetical protein [Pirellulaceae bacterium]
MPVLRQRSQVALSLVVLLFLISPLFAQAPALAIPATTDTGPFPTIPSEALLHQTEIQNVLQQGAGMEAQGDWGGAVAHYEESLLKFGYVPRIEKRKSHALKNYHLEIRLSDTSYSQAVQNLTERQAQNLLGEVLAKIQIYYVDAPDWSTLFREGTDQLKVSLLNQEFRQKFHPNVNKDRRQQLLTYLEKAATTAKLYSQA